MKHARSDYDRIQDPAGLIPADEPVFLLRGQDPSAPHLLRIWADMNLDNGGDPRASELARDQAKRMQEWQEKRMVKPTDLPAGV